MAEDFALGRKARTVKVTLLIQAQSRRARSQRTGWRKHRQGALSRRHELRDLEDSRRRFGLDCLMFSDGRVSIDDRR